MTCDIRRPTTDLPVAAERAGRALRYVDLRRRLRMSVPEVAAATGYSAGYVTRWGHAGLTAVSVPESALQELVNELRTRARADLEFLVERGLIPPQRVTH